MLKGGSMEEVLVSGLSRGELKTSCSEWKDNPNRPRDLYVAGTDSHGSSSHPAQAVAWNHACGELCGAAVLQEGDDLSSEICLQACREWFAAV